MPAKRSPLTFLILFTSVLFLAGCSPVPKDFAAEVLPSPTSARPTLMVHITDSSALAAMDIEDYVAGVVAGEMPNSWPLEALKAQAILARTFVLKFVTEKESRYPGADISTDIREAQAYDAQAINSRIRQAVSETAGLILLAEDGTLPYTWFHAHSGGTTESAVNGLDWRGEEPSYTRITEGLEADDAPDSAKAWSADFTVSEFIAACRSAGYEIDRVSDLHIGEKSKSGRTVTFWVNGTAVNAARLRISLGSTRMRSTLLTELAFSGGKIHMAGRGYGHGVGLSQWGARALAEQGWSAERIALHYYIGLKLVRAW